MSVVYIGQTEHLREFEGVSMEFFDPFQYKSLHLKTKYIGELGQNISALIVDLRDKCLDEYDLLLLQIAYTKSVPVFSIDPEHQIKHDGIIHSTCPADLLHLLHKFLGV